MTSRTWMAVGATGLIAVAALLLRGCDEYGEVSPRAYDVAKALYGACRRREDPQSAPRSQILEKLRDQIEVSLRAHEISRDEYGYLTTMINKAERGDVKGAAASARLMMEEQVR